MSSPRSESNDELKHMILPTAFEEILHIRDINSNIGYLNETLPLTVETSQKDQSTRRYISKKKETRKQKDVGTSNFRSSTNNGTEQRRAQSMVDDFPVDQRSQRKTRSRGQPESKSYGSLLGGQTVDGKWRYSNIFAPESMKKSRKYSKRSQSAISLASPSLVWPTYITLPLTPHVYDPTSNPPIRPINQADDPPYPLDMRSVLPLPHNYTMDEQYPYAIPCYQQSVKSMTTPSHIKTTELPPHGIMFSEGNGYRVVPADMPDFKEFEIEYATLDRNDGLSYLSNKDLNTIIQLARTSCEETNDLTEIATSLRKMLKGTFKSGKWHVVVGDSNYGSHVASVPGAMAKFLLGNLAFLVWQT